MWQILPVCGMKGAQVWAQDTLQLPWKFSLCFKNVLEDLQAYDIKQIMSINTCDD